MTNYAPQPPAPKSGMPGWLIAVIVILLVIIVGCGGGCVACGLLARKGAEVGVKKLQEEIEKEKKAQDARLRELEKATEDAPDTPADPNSIAGLPADWRKDIPIYPGLTSIATNSENKEGNVIFNGTGTPLAAAGFYRKHMKQQGWESDTDFYIGQSYIQTYSKNGRTASVTIGADSSGKLVVTILYGKE